MILPLLLRRSPKDKEAQVVRSLCPSRKVLQVGETSRDQMVRGRSIMALCRLLYAVYAVLLGDHVAGFSESVGVD